VTQEKITQQKKRGKKNRRESYFQLNSKETKASYEQKREKGLREIAGRKFHLVGGGNDFGMMGGEQPHNKGN